MEQSSIWLLLGAVLLCVGKCQQTTYYFPLNCNFFSYQVFQEEPIVVLSNQSIRNGSDDARCLPPSFCYQVLTDRRLAFIESQFSSGSAAAIFNPRDKSLPPVAISFVPENGTSPHLPFGVHLLKEYVIPANIAQDRMLLFTSDIENVATVGEIAGPSRPWDMSKLRAVTLFHEYQGYRLVYITGRMETQTIWVAFQFSNGTNYTIWFIPEPHVYCSTTSPVWIDWTNLTVTKMNIGRTGTGTGQAAGLSTLVHALLYLLVVNTFIF